MAFIRRLMAQGDPLPRTHMRAGMIAVPRPFLRTRVGPGVTHASGRFFIPSHPGGYRRADVLAGDPFLGKLFKKAGKALKKVTLKGVVKGVTSVAKLGASMIPGVGGILGAALGGGGGSAPEPVQVQEAAAVSPQMDQAAFRQMLEQYLAEQQAAQQQAAFAQWQQMQAMQSPFYAPNPWGF